MAQGKLIETKLQSSTSLIQSDGGFFMSLSIRHSDLIYKERLDGGSSGTVYLGEWDFNPVAIKKYPAQDFSEETQEEILTEATVMAQASTQSDYLVPLRGISLEKPHYCLVMQYMPGGNLYNFLHSRQDISWSTRYRIGLDISIGLHHLHSKDILHRDLKSFNVLLDSNGRAKLADFGSAKIKVSSAAITKGGFKGTILWAAPETFTERPTKKSDVYSAGMILWELASRKEPYKEAGGMVVEWIKSGKKEIFQTDTPEKFRTIAEECWQAPEKRPEAKVLATQLDQLWQAAQKSEIKEKAGPPSTSPSSSVGKKLNDGSQFAPTHQVDKTPKKQEEKEITKFVTVAQSNLVTQQSSVITPVLTTIPSLHASQPAFFGGPSSSVSTTSSEVKKPTPLDEKKHQQLMPLQNELVTACENGSLAKVKAAITKGALVDLPNVQGKNPLYCAVYGMNPEVVQYFIKQRDKNAPATSWSACEEHNKKYYGQTFLIMKFAPDTYKDWYDLLEKIEPNEFLVGYHLDRMQNDFEDTSWCCNFIRLKMEVRLLSQLRLQMWERRFSCDYTETGFEGYRNQIKQALEVLQAAQTNQSMGLNCGKQEEKENTRFMTQSGLMTHQSTIATQASTSTTPSLHASQPAFFSGASNSKATSSSEAKTKAAPLDEKKRQQLMPLQNELVTACENGSLVKVKAAIGKGALVDLPNAQGKNPLYCAMYGMNPEVVNYVIGQLGENVLATSWRACEEHNRKYYKQTFLIMKFAPVYYKDWYELLLRIEPNEFLAGYHLARCQDVWGVGDKDCESFVKLKDRVYHWTYDWFPKIGSMMGGANVAVAVYTEKGYEDYRDQIELAMAGLRMKQSYQSSMSLNGGGTN